MGGRRIIAALILAFLLLAAYGTQDERPLAAELPAPVMPAEVLTRFRGEDETTRRIRNASNEIVRVRINSDDERRRASHLGMIVEDYGSFAIVARSKGTSAKNYGLEEEIVETTVNLPGARFEPVTDQPEGSLRLGKGATARGAGYYIIQFGATATDEWLKTISDAGVEVLQYVPHQAYFVYAEAEAIARIADHSRIRWIGEYRPEHKLSSVVRGQLDAARKGTILNRNISPLEFSKGGTAVFDIAVFSRVDADTFAAELQSRFAKGPLQISRLQHNYFNLIRAELRVDDIEAVAAMPDVISIEAYIKSRNEDERSAQILAGNYLNSTTLTGSGYDPMTQFGADGTNVTVSVVDDGVGIPGEGGFYLTSLNTVNGPLRGAAAGAFGHGHFNATIIAGSNPYGPLDPLFFNYARGIAPRASIVNIPRNRIGYTGTDADVYNDSVSTPGPNGAHAMISNNSWGNGVNGNQYNAFAAQFDAIVRDASFHPAVDPIALIFSAGNDGSLGLTQPKVAKNVIAVGNSEGLRTELGGAGANNMDDLSPDSSRGPAADGRIKPDLVAPGTAVTGGRSGTDNLKGNIDAFHRWSSGTSHSAAQITGVAALFTNWWYSTRFGDRPSPSLIKAALINSARDINGENSSAPVPNGSEGWGRPNLKSMFNTGVGMKYIDEEVPLQNNGEGFELDGSVADSTKPVRVTLVWTDPPGVADPALVNNLDLEVWVGGTLYKGNVFSNGASVAGGSSDNRNNVENVFLPAGIPGGTSLKITARAIALNGDGILNNGDATDQNYSIVAYNWSNQAAPAFYSVAGRVTSPNGRGIGNAAVRFIDQQGVTRERRTNPLGYFLFTSLPGGQSYTINVTAKRYSFVQRVETISNNVPGMMITSSLSGP